MRRILCGMFVLAFVCAGFSGNIRADEADVTVVSSRSNQVELEKLDLDYRKGVRFWSEVCERTGLTCRVAGDYEMETQPANSSVFVFHLTERLTTAQRAHIVELQKKGVSLILVGLVGMFDDEGKRQKSLSEKWFGLQKVTPYTPTEAAYFVSLAGNVFALGNEPGFRFEYDWVGRYFVARTPFAAAMNVDWSLNPTPEPGNAGNNSVMGIRTYEKSRMAWFGVSPDAVADKPEHREFVLQSAGNLLLWAARRPVAVPCHWKDCHTGAAVVTADVEDRFETGDAIALACHKEKVQGSFFLVGSLAPDYPEVVTALSLNGEIGTHSMNHQSFKDVPYDDQLAELNAGKATLTQLGVERVVGFRPPMEEYDEATLTAVGAAELDFIYGNLLYDRSYPIVRAVEDSTIYQFARIVADDYNLVVERGVKDSTRYKQEYIKEFRKLYDMGGLFPFSFHTNYLALKQSVDVVRAMIRTLKKEDVWLTTFGQIVEWVETRRNVRVEAHQNKEQKTTKLVVSNSGPLPVKAFSIHYFPPSDVSRLKLVGTPGKGVKVMKAKRRGFVIQVDLNVGETKEINVR